MLDEREERLRDTRDSRYGPERFARTGRIRKKVRAIDQEQRAPVDADVPWIAEQRKQIGNQSSFVVGRILLREQKLVAAAVPAARPVLVRPADTEREIGAA